MNLAGWKIITSPGFIGSVVVLGLMVGAAVAFAQPGPYYTAGQAQKQAAVQRGHIVATVNGHGLSAEDLALEKAFVDLNNAVGGRTIADPKAALNSAIRNMALFEVAVRRGLQPSAAEVSSYIADVRAAFDSDLGSAHEELAAYLSGLGKTEDQFFADPATRDRYGRALAIGRLRAQVLTGVAPASQNASWTAFEGTTVANATVDILEPSLR